VLPSGGLKAILRAACFASVTPPRPPVSGETVADPPAGERSLT
jgi:hypothetical protein